jgi:hypothetical protein
MRAVTMPNPSKTARYAINSIIDRIRNRTNRHDQLRSPGTPPNLWPTTKPVKGNNNKLKTSVCGKIHQRPGQSCNAVPAKP